jgi:hypothetical protein
VIGLQGIPKMFSSTYHFAPMILGSLCPGATRDVLHGRQIFCGFTRAFFHARVGFDGAELSAPDARTNTDEPTKDACEVRLIMHPAVEAYL